MRKFAGGKKWFCDIPIDGTRFKAPPHEESTHAGKGRVSDGCLASTTVEVNSLAKGGEIEMAGSESQDMEGGDLIAQYRVQT